MQKKKKITKNKDCSVQNHHNLFEWSSMSPTGRCFNELAL